MVEQKARDIVTQQGVLNTIINPSWLLDREELDFDCAMLVESGELMDHIGYKWWEATGVVDINQARFEVIDLWFFLVSRELLRYSNEHVIRDVVMHFPFPVEDWEFDKQEIMNSTRAFGNNMNYMTLSYLTQSLGITSDILYDMYMGKLVLNIFRQTHGYADGSYVKIWNGLEDNEVLHKIMESTSDLGEIQLQLEINYEKVKE